MPNEHLTRYLPLLPYSHLFNCLSHQLTILIVMSGLLA